MQTKTKYVFGILLTTLLVLALTGCIQNERTPFTQTVTNPCNGETVTISGEIHTVLQSNEKNEAMVHVDAQGTGLGDQGNQYVFNEEQNMKLTQNTETQIVNVNVISKGNAPNFLTKIRYHIVDGNVIIDSISEECTGK